MQLQTVTPPTTNAVALDVAKSHLRVVSDDDDTYIRDQLLPAAEQTIATLTRRQLMAATYRLHLDRFPLGSLPIVLPMAPLVDADSVAVSYVDPDGNAATVDGCLVAAWKEPAEVVPPIGTPWPATQYGRPGAVTVEYQAGHASQAAVPRPLIEAVLLLVGHWYEHRESVVVGTIASELPQALQTLIETQRVGDDFIEFG